MTKGEMRVGKDFNPSGNELVGEIKFQTAGLIDRVEEIDTTVGDGLDSERARLKALAQTAFEEGAMWAVKAATKK